MRIILPVFALPKTRAMVFIFVLLGMTFIAQAEEKAEAESTQAEEKAKVESAPAKVSRLFQSHAPINMRLEGAFKVLGKKRKEDRPYSEGALIYKDDAGKDVRVELKMRVRGKFRAKRENCRFPPLKLNFKKKTVAGSLFEGEDKLKLVTHCQKSSRYEQFVLLEYLNYRMQNLLTEYSLLARLATIEYFDTGTGKVVATKVGFFIEDQARMSIRVGAARVKTKKIGKEYYNQDSLHLATVFEYMLGNTDFSVVLGPEGDECCHNIIPLQIADGSLVPIPYDFDATGIVNPPYVSPPEHLGIRSTRQRLYRGYCQSTQGFKDSFAIFQENRDAIFNLYNNQAGLNDKTLKSTVRYLESFYASITEDDKIAKEFIEKCRG